MTGIINDEIIERVNDGSILVDTISKYVSLKKTGNNYMGLCPFHNEKTPSFSVSQEKRLFHCFGCGEGGDAISFIMKMENLSFVDAVKLLARDQGIPLAEGGKVDKELLREKERIYGINRKAARFYYDSLIRDKRILGHLRDRKIGRKTLNRFGLGYALDSWDSIYRYLGDEGYSVDDMEKAGLIAKRRDGSGYYDRFRNRLMFPIIDTRGRVIGFGGRILDDSMPKYLNTQDTLVFTKGNNLYGLNLLKDRVDRDRIILVEGYTDVIALYENGIDYAVAGLGTAFTANQAKLLK
ncbi:MAG: DNA primase, partial [Tissierellia bacterium]|nr:DNA primase [Tissierellia bacterium]